MATESSELNLKERVHSDVWWRIKTGWTDAELLERKNAILTRVRDYGPDVPPRSPHPDFFNAIETLVATFNDRAWCLPGQRDRASIFAEQLRLYNQWARHISRELHRLPPYTPFTTDYSIVSSISLLNESVFFPAPLEHPSNEVVIPTATSLITVGPNPCSEAPLSDGYSAPFNWDDVEVYIDSRVGKDVEYCVPMTKLKPGEPRQQCSWFDFTLSRLFQYLRDDCHDEQAIKDTPCVIYWIRNDEWITINDVGDYQIMLKRFSQTPNTDGVIDLLLEKPPTIKALKSSPRTFRGKQGVLKR